MPPSASALKHERRDAVFDAPDAVRHLLVGTAARAAQTEVVVGEIDGVVARHDDVVRAAEALAVRCAGGEHRARAVLLESHDGAVVVRAPNQPTLRIQARAARPDQEHVRAAAARLRAGVADVRAAVAGLLHEHGDFFVGRDLVDARCRAGRRRASNRSCLRAPRPVLHSSRSRLRAALLRHSARRSRRAQDRNGSC